MKSYILFFLFKKCHNHHWLLFCGGACLNLSVWTGPNRNQNPGIRSKVHLKTWLQTTTLGSQLDTRRPELLFPPYYLFFLQWLCNVKYRSNSDQQPLFGAGFYKRGPHSRDPLSPPPTNLIVGSRPKGRVYTSKKNSTRLIFWPCG